MAKRTGRPIEPTPDRRVTLGFSVPPKLKDRLVEAACDNKRSQSQEAEFRLERSFDLEERFGGPGLTELVETIARVMKTTGEQAGLHETGKPATHGKWRRLPYAYDQVVRAVLAILNSQRPPGEAITPKWPPTMKRIQYGAPPTALGRRGRRASADRDAR